MPFRRDQRPLIPTGMRLMPRDVQAIEAVYLYRTLTQEQLERLVYVDCDTSVAKTRLRKLFQHGYLKRKYMASGAALMNTPALYLLDAQGAAVLAKTGKYSEIAWKNYHNRVRIGYLQHTLAINEVRICMTRACEQHGYGFVEWHDEREMKKQYDRVVVRGTDRAVIPDSHLAIQKQQSVAKSPAHFFLELDRTTETLQRFRGKVEAYAAYAQSKAYVERYGTKSLRVLTVTVSPKRLESLKRVTEAAGGANRFWFACLSDLTPENILTGSVWQVAGRQGLTSLFAAQSK